MDYVAHFKIAVNLLPKYIKLTSRGIFPRVPACGNAGLCKS
jgi:hypothetical protein